MNVVKPYTDAAKGVAQHIWVRSLHGPQLVAAGKENWREAKVHPPIFPLKFPRERIASFLSTEPVCIWKLMEPQSSE